MIDFVTIPDERKKKLRNNLSLYNRKVGNFFDVRISVGDGVTVEGDDGLQVSRTKEMVKAFGRGFDFADALDLVDEEYVLEVVNTTDFSGKSLNRQIELRGRVIGAAGRSKDIIEKYSGAKLAVYGKTVSIIGKWDSVKLAKDAVESLLRGAKHTSVFKTLEDRRIV